jgi:hypothetical protein
MDLVDEGRAWRALMWYSQYSGRERAGRAQADFHGLDVSDVQAEGAAFSLPFDVGVE